MPFDYLWEGGPQFKQSEHFRYGTDSILLGHFAPVNGVRRAIDLGCGAGVVSLLLLARSASIHVTGLEINSEAAALAEENMAHNGFSNRSTIVRGDIRHPEEAFAAGSFDLVVSNPPYFKTTAGGISPRAGRAEARGETACTLDDLCRAAGLLCRWSGRCAFVYRPERLPELFAAMTSYGIEPKRMRLVSHTAASRPSLVLVEGRRGGNPALQVEPVLILKNEDGSDTAEIRAIYRRS